MSRKILYIINPIAGTRTKKDLQVYIEQRTRTAGIPFQVVESVPGGDYSFLHTKLQTEGFTDVVIAGGDGTVSQVIGSLRSLPLHFGIIPCGSGNGLALAAGISKKPEKAMDVVLGGVPVATDAFYFNDTFACMLCGLGFDAKVAHDFARQSKRGLSTYVKQVVRNFFNAKPYTFEIDINGQSIQTNAFFISIANSNQFGNNFTIAPHASLQDGLLDIVIVTAQSKMRLLARTLRQIRGGNPVMDISSLPQSKKKIIYLQTESLQIRNRSGAPLHIDGDPAAAIDTASVRICKSCFQLLVPAPKK